MSVSVLPFQIKFSVTKIIAIEENSDVCNSFFGKLWYVKVECRFSSLHDRELLANNGTNREVGMLCECRCLKHLPSCTSPVVHAISNISVLCIAYVYVQKWMPKVAWGVTQRRTVGYKNNEKFWNTRICTGACLRTHMPQSIQRYL